MFTVFAVTLILFCCIFDQIKAALVSRRDFQKQYKTVYLYNKSQILFKIAWMLCFRVVLLLLVVVVVVVTVVVLFTFILGAIIYYLTSCYVKKKKKTVQYNYRFLI